MAVSGVERRKALRAVVPAELFFNILGSPEEYARGHTSILKRLEAIDAVKPPSARTESQILLDRIDQKLSILVSILAETASQKNYINHATMVDISEYGLAFSHALSFENGTILELGLQLPVSDSGSRLLDIAGRVVNVRQPPVPDGTSKNIYGVEFFDIRGKDQNDILQWIFAHQREQIRRRREKETF